MAYPTVSKPYGFRPINLIGGQPYAGSTRMFKIASGYASNIFYGDPVKILRDPSSLLPVDGTIVVQALSSCTTISGVIPEPYTVGVFMGCTFTNPVTKQKTFSQFYPAGTVANDIQAYVVDDPDALFKVVYVANAVQIGELTGPFEATGLVPTGVGLEYVGRNLVVAVNAGDTNTGNSLYGVADPANPIVWGAQFAMPVRVVDVVPETATDAGFVELIVKWNMPAPGAGLSGSGGEFAISFSGHEYYWPGSQGTFSGLL